MATYCGRCESDEDFAKASLFAIENKHELHSSYYTLDMVSLLCTYMTQGHMLYIADDEHRMIGLLGYYHGTPEKQFEDKDVVLADTAIMDRAYRGTRLFLKGLRYMVGQIIEKHPDVQVLRLVSLSDNAYLCGLYAKFAEPDYTREGPAGEETVFCVKIHQLKSILYRKYKV